MASSPPSKRRRTTAPPSTAPIEDEESTDYKLTLLLSLHPSIPIPKLLSALLSASGSVPAASSLLATSTGRPKTQHQTSLSSFLLPSSSSVSLPPRMPPKGTTLRLYSPADVSMLTPATLIHGFLPPTLANTLLRELLHEASTFPPPSEFTLFERTVVSPHTSCFFLRTRGDEESVKSRHTYYSYQGRPLPTRLFTKSMHAATELVEKAVEKARKERYEGEGRQKPWGVSWKPWKVNAAFVNQYKGPDQSVGFHTDELTYLGPMAVIASLSLGVEREFRVRRVLKDEAEEEKDREEDEGEGGAKRKRQGSEGMKNGKRMKKREGEGAIGIYLPHNSLLIMHGGMQEGWKHSIHPAKRLDTHPISGDARINITYRHYRESLDPKFTPRCKCDIPATLRPQFGPDPDDPATPRKYFWACTAGYHVGGDGKGCGLWREARFDEDGDPVWENEKADKGITDTRLVCGVGGL